MFTNRLSSDKYNEISVSSMTFGPINWKHFKSMVDETKRITLCLVLMPSNVYPNHGKTFSTWRETRTVMWDLLPDTALNLQQTEHYRSVNVFSKNKQRRLFLTRSMIRRTNWFVWIDALSNKGRERPRWMNGLKYFFTSLQISCCVMGRSNISQAKKPFCVYIAQMLNRFPPITHSFLIARNLPFPYICFHFPLPWYDSLKFIIHSGSMWAISS